MERSRTNILEILYNIVNFLSTVSTFLGLLPSLQVVQGEMPRRVKIDRCSWDKFKK